MLVALWSASFFTYHLTSYVSTDSEPSFKVGASQANVISVLFTEVTRTLGMLLVTLASVVTTTSAYLEPERVSRWDTPFSAKIWKRYVVTAFRPRMETFVSLKVS